MPKVGIKAVIDVTPQGARFPEGWIRVSRAEGNANVLNFDAEFYASEIAFDAGFAPLLTKSFSIPYQSGDLVTLLHSHLLTLNLDDAQAQNPHSRVRCNLSAGELITRPDPVLPEAEPLAEPEPIPEELEPESQAPEDAEPESEEVSTESESEEGSTPPEVIDGNG